MSTYYEYQDVSVMIAHKLMTMEGWEVYGYHAGESDSMTDYYSPAYWNGIAEKNGYILVFNESREAKPEEIRKYNYDGKLTDVSISEKIQKLQQMTVERGASEAEAETARNMIEKLQAKQSTNHDNLVVVGVRPGHLANPPKCNWHIEKDGIIIAKGNGLLKYSTIDSYYKYDSYMEEMQQFRTMDREAYRQKLIDSNMRRWNDTEERSIECAESHIKEMEEKAALMDQFESFINKIDTTCGALLGSGDGYIYEKITVTEYKKENKAVKTESGSIKEGQCFILTSDFNYGRYKGLVYRIHEIGEEGQKYFIAYKLNGKLTKECTGSATQNNRWYMGTEDRLAKWIEKGAISWCEIQEVKTPYEVEKVVKRSISNTKACTKKAAQKEAKTTTESAEASKTTVNASYTYDITEDTDTRDNSTIYVVKVIEKLDRDEYLSVNQSMKDIGGYYSRFKHGFIFKTNPAELLQSESIKSQEEPTQTACNTETEPPQAESKKAIEFDISEDKSPSDKIIYLVKVKNDLSKTEFAEVKQRLAKLNGFYSCLKDGFIFNYDPKEKLII